MAVKHNLIVTAVFVVPLLIYLHGEENRLVHYLEARGYSDIQMEHPDQWHCVRGWIAHSYRARLPNCTPVHGGACDCYFIIETTEPIGKKESARG